MAIGDSSYPARSCGGSFNIDEDCSGRAWVIYGRRRPTRVISLPRPGRVGYTIKPQRRRLVERVGAYVTAAGDLDGDGRGEVLVGALAHNGTVPFVLWGGRRRTRPLVLSERWSHLWEEFGYGLEAVPIGDIDGDGAVDLVAREPNFLAERPPNDPKGSVNVVFGHRWRGGLRAGRARPPGAESFIPAPGSGIALGRAGDVNGDMIQDLLVSRLFGSVSTAIRSEDLVIFGPRPVRPVDPDSLGGQGSPFGDRPRLLGCLDTRRSASRHTGFTHSTRSSVAHAKHAGSSRAPPPRTGTTAWFDKPRRRTRIRRRRTDSEATVRRAS